VKATGDPKRVVDAYLIDVEEDEEQYIASGDAKARDATEAAVDETADPPDMFQATEGRWGSREIEIVDVTLEGEDGDASHVFPSGARMSIRVRVKAEQPVADFVFGIGLFNAEGVCCYGTNTDLEELKSDRMAGEGEVVFTIDTLDLVAGTYKLDVAVHKRDGYPYDYHRLLYTFRVKSRTNDIGIFRPRHRWTFPTNIRFTGPLE